MARPSIVASAAVAVAALCGGLAFVAPHLRQAPGQAPERLQVGADTTRAAAASAAVSSVPAVVGLTLVGVSAALALASRQALTTGRKAATAPGQKNLVSLRAFESELGVQAPFGFWDPIGFTKDGDAEKFRRRRSTEIKHGRISMLATMGYITPEVAGKFPGYLSPSQGLAFEDVPNGLAALSKVPVAGWVQMVAYCWFCERSASVNGSATGKGNYVAFGEKTPGDVGWKPPLLSGFQGDAKTSKLNAEIANGRLAMVAIIGMFYQDGLTGSAWGDWANYADSPLRAFESELGVQAPVGFWDPIGYCKDGDADAFRRRRMTELKHGRVSMIACIGYIVPEYFKWPGYCSPSSGLSFEDIPNGLAALSKVPAVGWSQIFLFGGILETGFFAQEDDRAPGNFTNAGPLGVPNGAGSMTDAASRKTKLNAELANGRLAMMAIIGMFYQDGLTGSAWGDWAMYTDSPLR